MKISPPPSFINDTGTPKGRGVFAARAIVRGEIVETCPVVVFEMPFRKLPRPIKTMVFSWEALAGVPDSHALALGFGCMYNHDNPANLRYEADGESRLLRFIAVRDIPAGEELTINYSAHGGGAEWHDDNWFKRMRVKLFTGEPEKDS